MKNVNLKFQHVPVAILCGGRTVTMGQSPSNPCNKALVRVNGKPLFWWIMLHYARYGATEFLLATGLQGDRFDPALLELGAKAKSDEARNYEISIGNSKCSVRLVPTRPDAGTAERLLECKPWLSNSAHFALTYSDTLSTIDLNEEMKFHENSNLVATLVAIPPPVRFRILGMRQGESLVRAFAPRPVVESSRINGGFYLFSSAIWESRYGIDDGGALEETPLEQLAGAGQLAAYEAERPCLWHYCDADRDLETLRAIAEKLNQYTENSANLD